MTKLFARQYRMWLDDCLEEFNQRFEPRRLHQEHDAAAEFYPYELVEFTEDGDAYPHGLGGIGHIPKAVTPWEDSPHYVHWST